MKNIEKKIIQCIGEWTVKLWEYDFDIEKINENPEISTEDYNEIHSKIVREQHELTDKLKLFKEIYKENYKDIHYK